MRPWLNWIEHRSTEPKVAGSNLAGRVFLFKAPYTSFQINSN